jgi:hypothetical protein
MKVKPEAMQEQVQGRYTIHLNGRNGLDPKLTYNEAIAMYMLGFRFSIRPLENSTCRYPIRRLKTWIAEF